MRKLRYVLALVLVLCAIGFVRRFLHHRIAKPSEALLARAKRVRILRDIWGVPHIFGQTDADAAFGLAYAHAEDDFPTIQGVAAASTGRLSLLTLSQEAVQADWLASFLDTGALVKAQYPLLSNEARALLEGYADGLNLYAALHPQEADARLLPYRGEDIAAQFAFKLPILVGVPETLQALEKLHPAKGERFALREQKGGSNAHALMPFRSTDHLTTRLNINSHQPWEGPVSWYEAQLRSGEGLNIYGGLFPGAPVILHGFNDFVGWAHTVNSPSMVDAYELQLQGAAQIVDGVDWPLEERRVWLQVDLGFAAIPIPLRFRASRQGPIFSTGGRDYAIRYVGRERAVLAAEEWYRMDRARSMAELSAAMDLQAIPMMNTVSASRDGHVRYLYNALLPLREDPQLPPRTVLDGARSSATWTHYLPYRQLPQVDDPPSGFVFNTNSTPFAATSGAGNPRAEDFPPAYGIETNINNRARRSLQLFGGTDQLDAEEFKRRKFDRTYAEDSTLVQAIAALPAGRDAAETKALEVLRGWNRVADEQGPALPILFAQNLRDPAASLRHAVQLASALGGVDVPLGEAQRLRRGKIDLPLGGAPDVLNATHANEVAGKLVGKQGDSLVILVEYGPGGASARSIIQYGASNRPASPHYADEAPLFVRHELKPVWRDPEEIRKHLEREYIPGQ